MAAFRPANPSLAPRAPILRDGHRKLIDLIRLYVDRATEELAEELAENEWGKIEAAGLVPGRQETLRVNGRAWITRDEELLDTMLVQGERPPRRGRGVFLHCAKALVRSHPLGYRVVAGFGHRPDRRRAAKSLSEDRPASGRDRRQPGRERPCAPLLVANASAPASSQIPRGEHTRRTATTVADLSAGLP
jgi:hypothetical protein